MVFSICTPIQPLSEYRHKRTIAPLDFLGKLGGLPFISLSQLIDTPERSGGR